MGNITEIKKKIDYVCEIIEFINDITSNMDDDDLDKHIDLARKEYSLRQLLIHSVSMNEQAEMLKKETEELCDMILKEIVSDEKKKRGENGNQQESKIPPEVLEVTMNFFLGIRKTKRGEK